MDDLSRKPSEIEGPTASAMGGGADAQNSPRRDRQSDALLSGVGPDSNEFESRNCQQRKRRPIKERLFRWRRMGDSNPRELALNALSKRAP